MPFRTPPQGLPPEGMPQPYHPPEPPQLMDYPGELTNPNPVTHLQYPEYYVPGGELPPPPTTRPGSGIYSGPSDLEAANPAGYQDPPNPFPTPLPSGGSLSPMELGYLEAPETPSLEEQTFGNDQFPLVDFPQAPAPQTPPLPGNPIAGRQPPAGRGPALPLPPKQPSPFGGGK